MAFVRQHLRALATTLIVLQVAWLTALVPRDCCAAHRPADSGCHESASATQCPMRAADGTPCPMHRAPEHQHDAAVPAAECLSRGCDGPMAALFALLSGHGILPDTPSAMPSPDVRFVLVAFDVNLVGHVETPDPPPPRA